MSSDCSELLLSEKGQEAYRKTHEAMTSVVRSILEELGLSYLLEFSRIQDVIPGQMLHLLPPFTSLKQAFVSEL